MISNISKQQTKQSKLKISFLMKWLLKLFITDKIVVIFCLIVGPLLSVGILEFMILMYRGWIVVNTDTKVFIKLSLMADFSIFSIAPFSLIIIPLFFNRIRRSTFIYKLKFFDYQKQFLAILFLFFFVAMFIEMILFYLLALCINMAMFNEMKTILVQINFIGIILLMFLGSLFFASFSLLLGTVIKKMLSVVFAGIILFIIYIIASGCVVPFFQLRNTPEINYISYFSPFTYINGFAQLAIVDLSKYITLDNGSIFKPFNDMSFPLWGGDFMIMWHTYDIWLDWILVIGLTAGAFIAPMVISTKTRTLWLID